MEVFVKHVLPVAALLIAVVFASAALAAEPTVVLLGKGLGKSTGQETVVEAPKTADNRIVHNERVEIIESTDRVEAAMGRHFGFNYKIVADQDAVTINRVWQHPPMTDPDGKVWETQESAVEVETNETHWFGYMFEHDFELVKGKWTMTIQHQGEDLFTTEFDVY